MDRGDTGTGQLNGLLRRSRYQRSVVSSTSSPRVGSLSHTVSSFPLSRPHVVSPDRIMLAVAQPPVQTDGALSKSQLSRNANNLQHMRDNDSAQTGTKSPGCNDRSGSANSLDAFRKMHELRPPLSRPESPRERVEPDLWMDLTRASYTFH